MCVFVCAIDISVVHLTAKLTRNHKYLVTLCDEYRTLPDEVIRCSGAFDATAGIMLDLTLLPQVARCDNEWDYSC